MLRLILRWTLINAAQTVIVQPMTNACMEPAGHQKPIAAITFAIPMSAANAQTASMIPHALQPNRILPRATQIKSAKSTSPAVARTAAISMHASQKPKKYWTDKPARKDHNALREATASTAYAGRMANTAVTIIATLGKIHYAQIAIDSHI